VRVCASYTQVTQFVTNLWRQFNSYFLTLSLLSYARSKRCKPDVKLILGDRSLLWETWRSLLITKLSTPRR